MFNKKVSEKDLKKILKTIGYDLSFYGFDISPLVHEKYSKLKRESEINYAISSAKQSLEIMQDISKRQDALYEALGYEYVKNNEPIARKKKKTKKNK